MTTYSEEDFEKIAASIEKHIDEVVKYEKLFEGATDWYRLDCGLPREDLIRPHGASPSKRREKLKRIRPRRTPPSKMRKKLQNIAESARRLLKDLGIATLEEAFDGSGNFELLEVLATAEVPSEDAVVNATRRVAQLVTMIEAIEAAGQLGGRAVEAAGDDVAMGKLTMLRESQGDAAVNNWIAAMMEIYHKITGSEPRTSVGHEGQPNEGVASGPFIRFLRAAGAPVGIAYSEDAFRSRFRTILNSH